MQEIHFSEEQLADLQAIGASLFEEDASDPRSWNYNRQLIRPAISWMRILAFVALACVGMLVIYHLLVTFSVPQIYACCICVACVLILILVCLKRILICFIQIYQRYAPASIRNKCRFEPSCSQYMILSLQKYGTWRGLKKGINRLKRCNAEDGGFDYP